MIVPIAILVVAGCAMIGWNVGLGAFAAVFEGLRQYELDAVLDSPRALDAFRKTFAVLGGLGGVWLMLRWRSMDLLVKRGLTPVRSIVLGTIAAAGGAAITAVSDVGGLAIRYFQVDADYFILNALVGALLALLIAAGIAVGHYAGYRPLPRYLARSGISVVLALGLIWLNLAFDKAMTQPYAKLGEIRSVQLDIRLPANVTVEPNKATVRVELRSGENVTRGRLFEWRRDDGRLVLRASIVLAERTRERVVALSVSDQPDRLFRLDLSPNPKPTAAFGEWIRAEKVEPGGAEAQYQMRYLIR